MSQNFGSIFNPQYNHASVKYQWIVGHQNGKYMPGKTSVQNGKPLHTSLNDNSMYQHLLDILAGSVEGTVSVCGEWPQQYFDVQVPSLVSSFFTKSADPDRRAQSSSSYVESKICHKIQNPKSKIQNPQTPKSKIQNPQNPKSKIPKIQNPKSPKSPKSKIWGFWILDSGDFGFKGLRLTAGRRPKGPYVRLG